MKVDFTIKPEFEAGGKWSRAKLIINTEKGANAYNEWFCTEYKKGDSVIISSSSSGKTSYNELKDMINMSNCSSVFS